MVRTSVLCLGLLAATALGGCIGTDAVQARLGDAYVYSGSDGSLLSIEVAGPGERMDAHGRTHNVLILEIGYRPPGEERTYRFEEAVDTASGLIVQQVSHCGVPVSDSVSGPFWCLDERAQVVLSAGGIPGAFGAGPLLMGLKIEGGVEVHPVEPALRAWAPTPVATSQDDDCVSWTYPGAPDEQLRVAAWTVVEGPFTICPHSALPTTFRTHGAWTKLFPESDEEDTVLYTQVEHVSGGGAAVAGTSDSLWRAPGTALEPQEWPDPPFLDMPTTAPVSVRDAHAVAMDQADEYRMAFEEHGMVLGFTQRWSGSIERPLGSSHEDRYEVKLVAQGTPPIRATVEYRIREDIVPLTEPGHRVLDVQSLERRLDGDNQVQASLAGVEQLGRALTGLEMVGSGFLAVDAFPTPAWTFFDGWPQHHGGLMLYASYSPSTSGGGGETVGIPWKIGVDGSTGGIMQVDVPPGRLPLVSL